MGKRVNPRQQHYWYKALLLGLFFSAAFFIPYMVLGEGYFLYYGDFNVQQVPFYKLVHDAIRSGNWQWSTTTDLGSSLIGSYTFYLLGSPFFWLTLPFPSDFVPYLMGPLLILKFGIASLTGYIYISRYTRDKNNAVIGGLLYAFSGYSVYNVFFNHFHEAIVVFPLLLAAIDEYMDRKRRGVVALAVFAACFMNYYFFVGMVAFVIIYWFLRMYLGTWKLNLRDFIPLAIEVVLGFAATAIILVPTVMFVSQNPRIDDFPRGYGALLYGSEQRYLHILSSLFFPPDIPARPNFTPDSNSKWSSIAAWLPLFGMTGVIAFLQSNSKSWLKKLLPLLFVCAMVPVLNSVFQMFVMSYYARWFYMLTLMMSLATVLAIENTRTQWKKAINLVTVITMAITLGIGLMPNDFEGEVDNIFDAVGLESYTDRFWVYTAIAMLSLAIVTLLIHGLKRNRKTFYPKAMACVGIVAVIYSAYIIGLGKSHSYDIHNFVIPVVINQQEEIQLDDDLQNVRSDFFDTMDNVGMFWQIPNIQAFHSIVPGSIYDFYPSVGVTRDVGSRPEPQYYGLRSLLSVKYLFDYAYDDSDFENDEGQTRMPGYKYIDTQNDFKIYENKNYIPYGFYFDSYITEEQYYDFPEENRHLLLLKAMVLSDEQAEKYGDLMTHIVFPSNLNYDVKVYANDCKALQENTCSKFEYGNSSFKAQITCPKGQDRLVFFSVPYEKGWSATVNGEKVDIEKVDIGFMAVRVPGGETSDIKFTYSTPGLIEGIIITIAAVILYIAYMIVSGKNNKIKPLPKMKKQYKVAAFGSADELGERYRNLVAGRNPMKKPTFKSAADISNEEEGNPTDGESGENSESDVDSVKISLAKSEPFGETAVYDSDKSGESSAENIVPNTVIEEVKDLGDDTKVSDVHNSEAEEVKNLGDDTKVSDVHDSEVEKAKDLGNDTKESGIHNSKADTVKESENNNTLNLFKNSKDDEKIDGIIIGNLDKKVMDSKGKNIFKNIDDK